MHKERNSYSCSAYYLYSNASDKINICMIVDVFMLVSLMVIIIILGTTALVENNETHIRLTYQSALNERTLLIHQIEQYENKNIIIEEPKLYENIIKFNNKIIDAKINIDNPWFDWYVSKAYTMIDPIIYVFE